MIYLYVDAKVGVGCDGANQVGANAQDVDKFNVVELSFLCEQRK